MKQLVIIGARGFGREVFNSACESVGYGTEFVVKGFLDDKKDALNGYEGYSPILDTVESYNIENDDVFVCALGDVKFKEYYTTMIMERGGEFITLIHKTAYLSRNVKYGVGCLILAGARIQADAVIGDHVTLQPYSILGHDARVGDWTIVNAYADCGGYSRIGNRVTLNTTCFVIPKGIVEDGATVGAGSVTMRKVKAGTTVFGVPARPLVVPQIKNPK